MWSGMVPCQPYPIQLQVRFTLIAVDGFSMGFTKGFPTSVLSTRNRFKSSDAWSRALIISLRLPSRVTGIRGAYHLTEKSGWGVESLMVSNLPVYRRNATSVTVWIQKKGEFVWRESGSDKEPRYWVVPCHPYPIQLQVRFTLIAVDGFSKGFTRGFPTSVLLHEKPSRSDAWSRALIISLRLPSRVTGIRSFRSMVRSFQLIVRSFHRIVSSFHRIVSSFHKKFSSFHSRMLYLFSKCVNVIRVQSSDRNMDESTFRTICIIVSTTPFISL